MPGIDRRTVERLVAVNRQSTSWPLLQSHGVFGVDILAAEPLDVAERFSGKDGAKGAARFAGAQWTTGSTCVPPVVGALAATDCEVEEIIERHSQPIIIRRVLGQTTEPKTALSHGHGQYVAIDQNEDAVKLAEVGIRESGLRAPK